MKAHNNQKYIGIIKKYKNKPKWNKWRQQKKKTKLLTHMIYYSSRMQLEFAI